MPSWLDLDWHRIFVPHVPLLETIIRGSVMYLTMFALLRVFRRQTGSLGPADLLVLLLIADAAQNGMADDYKSITEGIVLVGTIMGWEYLIDWLSYRMPLIGKYIERDPLMLICDGQILEKNLDREMITKDDLLSQLRQKGVDDPAKVACCCLEGDGHISVITFDRSSDVMQHDQNDQGQH
ncbi:hypothetical protein AYO47_00825 [Planctomyces sp. SCGC AG-212-M04]|nr:hypothetical protein AYO47_00825 [Planctomyces sp. SCGC AG-212-M04]